MMKKLNQSKTDLNSLNMEKIEGRNQPTKTSPPSNQGVVLTCIEVNHEKEQERVALNLQP